MNLVRLRGTPRAALATARRKLDPRRITDARRFWRRLHDFHAEFVESGDLVFDIGANIGDYTAAFRAMDASVIAVEPNPETLQRLRRRFERDRSVVIVTEGVSDAPGTKRLYISPQGGVYTTMSPDWAEAMQDAGFHWPNVTWNPSGEVPVTTLDSLIEQFGVPAFVKIDVEGHELQVIRGLTQPVGALSLETHPEVRNWTMAALQHLQSLGALEFMYVRGDWAPFVERAMPGLKGEWMDLEALEAHLEETTRPGDYGDVLVRFSEVRSSSQPSSSGISSRPTRPRSASAP